MDEERIEENRRRVAELIDGIDIAMMTTIDESGELHSRPMYTQEAVFDGEVWFFADGRSPKADDIRRNPRVNLGYARPDRQTYLSLAGHAEVVEDRDKMAELWNPMLEAWFPQKLETPGIALIKVEAGTAQYWDSPSNPVAHLIGLVKAKTTGHAQPVGDNETLELGG